MGKYKVYILDSLEVAGGWKRIAIIEAEDEREALGQARQKWSNKVMVKKVN